MNHIKTDYGKLNVSEFIGKARQIHECLSAPVFTSPNPPLNVFESQINSLAASATSFPVNIIERNQLRNMLEQTLALLGSWVENFCNNDIVLLQASGFELTVRKRIGIFPQPQGLKANTSGIPGSGSAFLKWRSIQGCRAYQLQYASYPTTPQTEWKDGGFSTKAKCEIGGLQSGYISFRIIAISSAGKSVPSEVATIIIG